MILTCLGFFLLSTFCIIFSMLGDLDSRLIGDVLGEAKRLVDSGVKG